MRQDSRYKRVQLRMIDWGWMGITYIKGWLRGKKIIHVIGDSHALAYRSWPPFVVHYLGPATMHNLGSPKSTNRSGDKLNKALGWVRKEKDMMILVFGEIDCRIHFYYQYKKQGGRKPFEALIGETLERFSLLVEKLTKEGYEVAVQGVVAPGRETNKYGYPEYAGAKVRAQIYREFNRQLRENCVKNDILLIDLYRETVGKDGLVKQDLVRDEVHIKDEVLRRVVESGYYERLTN